MEMKRMKSETSSPTRRVQPKATVTGRKKRLNKPSSPVFTNYQEEPESIVGEMYKGGAGWGGCRPGEGGGGPPSSAPSGPYMFQPWPVLHSPQPVFYQQFQHGNPYMGQSKGPPPPGSMMWMRRPASSGWPVPPPNPTSNFQPVPRQQFIWPGVQGNQMAPVQQPGYTNMQSQGLGPNYGVYFVPSVVSGPPTMLQPLEYPNRFPPFYIPQQMMRPGMSAPNNAPGPMQPPQQSFVYQHHF